MKDGFISRLQLFCEQSRAKGKIIGLTNGCFDLLHDGHKHLLKEAKKNCDILIVAINGDESVRRLKGSGRPVETKTVRVKNLISTKLVDWVVGFDTEQELLAIMKEVTPDILIKGSDYRGMSVTGAGYIQKVGGKVVMINLLDGFSTTKQIEGLNPQQSYVKINNEGK